MYRKNRRNVISRLKEIRMNFKVGDRVRVIKTFQEAFCTFMVGDVGVVCDEAIDGWKENGTKYNCCWVRTKDSKQIIREDYLELIKENSMSKYEELKKEIENLNGGWTLGKES
jgi:hypothetical protein